jgi:hypothetical protein
MANALSEEFASQLVGAVVANVTREFPNKMDHVLTGAGDVRNPRAFHPIFYGSFDWHSCVHGYWLLCHLYRRFPALPEAGRIRDVIDTHFTTANVAAELDYLLHPARATFERPYGWAWLLMLAGELAGHASPEGRTWHRTLSPLAEEIAQRMRAYAQAAIYPVRSGTHGNTAFAAILAAEYAALCGDEELHDTLRRRAEFWFGHDVETQAWEPSGEDFLSPALTEAHCMLRLHPEEVFAPWLERFLPQLAKRQPAALFRPAIVPDRCDPKFVHLDGLNLSRAWSYRALARCFAADDPRREVALESAAQHVAASLPHIFDDYAGGHWLASFAVLALSQ